MAQLWWRQGKVGDKLVVNGQPVKDQLHLYHKKVFAEDEQSLGVFDSPRATTGWRWGWWVGAGFILGRRVRS